MNGFLIDFKNLFQLKVDILKDLIKFIKNFNEYKLNNLNIEFEKVKSILHTLKSVIKNKNKYNNKNIINSFYKYKKWLEHFHNNIQTNLRGEKIFFGWSNNENDGYELHNYFIKLKKWNNDFKVLIMKYKYENN